MKKNENQPKSKAKNLIIIFALTAIIISASTYAWFVGLRTVNMSSFDIGIAVTDSLLLSLNGRRWDTTVFISEDNYNDTNTVYSGNTNTWGGKGLIPLSSVGEMDVLSSRMKLYEKSSFTATPGGYRIMASLVNNKTTNPGGYIAFDLFIKNLSGRKYISELNALDEEAIYLTADSLVTIGATGNLGTGIENSVRVAFAQVGRVAGNTTDPNIITGIKCNGNSEGKPTISEGVTGICRNAAIWEPNDTLHNINAISWYNKSCLKRTGSDLTKDSSYGGSCKTLKDGVAYPTYVINSPISSADNVDIYDGIYNSYNNTTKLTNFPFFTDTLKENEGTNRTEIFTLGANSITKVRIYIYIEGQDIDNYDFAALGKRISIEFGFTKQRFNEEDIDHEKGPDYGSDVWAPIISIDPSDTEININQGEKLVLPTATAIDKYGEDESGDLTEDLTRRIVVTNPVNTNIPGTYYVTYDVSDWAGNYAEQIILKVNVI